MTGSQPPSTVPTFSSSDLLLEERRRRRDLKKEKKKKKKKKKRKHEKMMSSSPEEDDAVTSDSVAAAAAVISPSKEVTKLEEKKEGDGTPESRGAVEKKKSSKEKKKKKKRKEKKRRRRHVDDDDDTKEEDKEERTKKKKRRRREKDEEEQQQQQRNEDGGGGGDDDYAKKETKTKSTTTSTCSVSTTTTTPPEEESSIVGGRVAVSSALQYLGNNTNKSSNTSTGGGDGISGTGEKDDPASTSGDDDNNSNTAAVAASTTNNNDVTLLLFYQYVDPPWDHPTFQKALQFVQQTGVQYDITGRMRVATEGLNCTLTGSYDGIRSWCASLRTFGTRKEFVDTEFKLTDHLPHGQLFPKLHAFKVTELVNYGLAGSKAPSITKTGTHLEPKEYHTKIGQDNTVLIDVRNHYEANIGHFIPPPNGAQWLDPKMRKSTEFPPWLDKHTTREQLRGKQVLMYCTGGVRCERASALLRQKMETDPTVAELGIKGVYQLQGGIDKYFKEFPEGGYWKGKNYVFDKRFAHAPPAVEAEERTTVAKAVVPVEKKDGDDADAGANAKEITCKAASDNVTTDTVKLKDSNVKKPSSVSTTKMGKCESCSKPWDMYRGKRRCPTCGVPSLICRDCYNADKNKTRKLNKWVRCSLCVEENVTSKFDVRERERLELEEYERKERDRKRQQRRGDDVGDGGNGEEDQGGKEMNGFGGNGEQQQQVIHQSSSSKSSNGGTTTSQTSSSKALLPPNPENITRLLLKNLHAKKINESILLSTIPNITHIYWITDRKRQNKFYGSAFVEMKTPNDAAYAIGMSNNKVQILGRVLKVQYMKADGKDVWPPPNCQVGLGG